MLVIAANHVELCGANRLNGFFRGFDLESKRRDSLQLGFDCVERQAEVKQRGDEHVAADATDEFTVRYPHPIHAPLVLVKRERDKMTTITITTSATPAALPRPSCRRARSPI